MPRLPEWQKLGLEEPTSETNKYQIEVLQEQHKAIARLVAQGLGNNEIAEIVGCTPQMVSYTRNSAVTVRMVNELDAAANDTTVEALQSIREKAVDAARIMFNIADCEEAPLSIRLRAASEILDRAGVSKTISINTGPQHGHFRREDIERLKDQVRAEINASAIPIESEAVG